MGPAASGCACIMPRGTKSVIKRRHRGRCRLCSGIIGVERPTDNADVKVGHGICTVNWEQEGLGCGTTVDGGKEDENLVRLSHFA